MNANANSTVPTFKAPSPVPAKDSQRLLDANSLAASILSPSLDPTLSADGCRKKSGFMITRIDKASISSALENESDMENEFFNDRAGAGCRSPGSSSVISESSSIFDEGASPEKSTIPRIVLQNATPVISPCPSRPSAFLPPSALRALNAATSGLQDQETVVGVSVLSPLTSTLSPAANSSKDTPSSASSSRFHIIKIDSGPYKRGRWNCRDFDEACSSAVRSDMIAVGGPRSGSSDCSSGKTSYYVVDENGRQTAGDGPQTPLLLLAGTAVDQQLNKPPTPSVLDSQQHQTLSNELLVDSTIQQRPVSNETIILLSNSAQQRSVLSSPVIGNSPQQVPLPSTNKFTTPSGVALNSAAAAILDSIIVGSIHQQGHPLLFSTSPTKEGVREAALIVENLQSVEYGSDSGMVQNAGSASAETPSVAIDNKIEQAMDLVKTHLLYAVREEVEVLKEKIIDLEKKVFRLETENKLLREYAPPEILQQIQQQNGAGQTVSSVMASEQRSSLSPQPQVVANPSTLLVNALTPIQHSPLTAGVPISGTSDGMSNSVSPLQQQLPSSS